MSKSSRLGEAAAVVSALAAVVALLFTAFGLSSRGKSSEPTPMPEQVRALAVSTPPGTWQQISEPSLTVTFAVPGGWKRVETNQIQSRWRSQDDTYRMAVKRDDAWGPTAEKAVAGQLAWYRDTGQSAMTDIKAQTRTVQHNGGDALVLDLDYRWASHSAPRKRVELFVAARDGYVYQLLVDTEATPGRLAELRRIFDTASARFQPDTKS